MMQDDFYQMYLEELELMIPCSEQEEELLLSAVQKGDMNAKKRLIEGNLLYVLNLAKEYGDQGLPLGDLIQEANMALTVAVEEYQGGKFKSLVEHKVEGALRAAINEQSREQKIEEEITARVNVLKDISQKMAEELGREATVEELSHRMKMSEEEIKSIMKLTLDAMSISVE